MLKDAKNILAFPPVQRSWTAIDTHLSLDARKSTEKKPFENANLHFSGGGKAKMFLAYFSIF